MPIKPLAGPPFSTIKTWLFEHDKPIVTNPLTGAIKIVKNKEIDVTNLANVLSRTHGDIGTINQLVNELNALVIRVTQLEARMSTAEANISALTTRLSTLETVHKTDNAALRNTIIKSQQLLSGWKGRAFTPHTHFTSPTGGPSAPPTMGIRKGGKLQKGGNFTKPVITSREEMKQKLIAEIKTLQEQ